MIRTEKNNLVFYRFALFDHPSLVQAVFTRLGGASSAPFDTLNIGRTVGDDPNAVDHNQSLVYNVLGVQANQTVMAHQVHGVRVSRVNSGAGGSVVDDTDAMVTNSPGIALQMRYADCVPVVLWDPEHNAIGLVHAGWQGTLMQVTKAAVERMVTEYNTQPDVLRAGIGPAIGPCCFEVGPEVVAKVQSSLPDASRVLSRQTQNGHAHFDLWAANKRQLEHCGVREIEMAERCTCCHQEEFYSHRGSGGRTGRFAVIIGMR
ncbi:MAG: peptidoglycan editing factor PgeF [Anaerolineae bacterium]